MIVRKTTDDMAANSNAMLGLSGLDTAAMLKSMMKPYKIPITSVSQKQQVVIWRQERYRELISKINDLKNTFLTYRSPATNLTSAVTWKQFLVDNPGSEYVKISATGETKPKSGTVELIGLPTASKINGRTGLLKEVEGAYAPFWSTATGTYLTINMDGIERSVPITSDITGQPTSAGKVAKLQDALDSTFGAGMLFVEEQIGGALRLTCGPAVNQFRILDGSMSTARLELGFGGNSNLSNKVALGDTIGILGDRMKTPIKFKNALVYDANGTPVMRDVVEFAINGTSFQFTRFDSISKVMNTINGSACGAIMSYDSREDRFVLTARTCGPGETIALSEKETGFFAAIGLGFYDESTALPNTNIIGGAINPGLVSMVNASNSLIIPEPYIFNVTVNGVTKSITLARNNYLDAADLLADANAQLLSAFPKAGVSVGMDPPLPSPGPWNLVVNIDKTKPNPAWSIKIEADAMTPAGAMDDFGLTGINDKILTSSPEYVTGAFGKVIIDGVYLQVDRPVFQYDGVLYDLKKAPPPGEVVTYEIKTDTDKIVDLVRKFVESYNDLVRSIGAALGEKRDRDYMPLSDEEKDKLSEKEIEKWEAKAKTGIIRGDVQFASLLLKIRQSISNPVYDKYADKKANAYSLAKMGVDTRDGLSSYNPADHGALFINEQILRDAIEKDIDEIAQFFVKKPETFTPDAEDAAKPVAWKARMQRMYDDKTGGLTTRLLNALDDYVRTMRGANNAKGVLIERAGIINDASEISNAMSREIFDYERRLNALWKRYDKIEKQKIHVLSRLETIVSKSAGQLEWLQGQMGQR